MRKPAHARSALVVTYALTSRTRMFTRRFAVVSTPAFRHPPATQSQSLLGRYPNLVQQQQQQQQFPHRRCWFSTFDLGPLQCTEVVLHSVHQWSHLPWWVVIVGTTLVLRGAITLPLAMHQMKMVVKQELLLPKLKELQELTLHRVVVECRKANLTHTDANKRFQKEVQPRSII